ncbi:MAG TPA: hypothetical protein VEK11_14350 [Thermoanaerobaculia bacterium]|nr:hypothetical protein [Thermoanaerobaculia bacterium]
MTRVLKFGGTSVGSPESLANAVEVIRKRAAHGPVVVVVSALSGVTSALDAAAASGDPSIVDSLRDRHTLLLHELTSASWNGSGRTVDALFAALTHALALRPESSTPEHDLVLGIGERLAAPLVTEVLRHRGIDATAIDATDVVRTDGMWGEARVDFVATRARLLQRLASVRGVPVITGYVGATAAGVPTTVP